MIGRLILLLALLFVALPAEAGRLDRKDSDLDFRFAWPALPRDVPRLETMLGQRAAAAQAQRHREAVRMRREDRRTGGGTPPRHSYEEVWRMGADTPLLLSLSAAIQLYEGGAHEGLGYKALIWDRRADRAVPLTGLFASPATALRLLERDYCAAFRAEKAERTSEDASGVDCPQLAQQPVALTGRGGKVRAVEVLLEPYVAGSWAEGPYEIEVPIRPSVKALVKGEYRGVF